MNEQDKTGWAATANDAWLGGLEAGVEWMRLAKNTERALVAKTAEWEAAISVCRGLQIENDRLRSIERAAREVVQQRTSLTNDRIAELCMRMEQLRDDAEHPETIMIASDAYIALAELLKKRQYEDALRLALSTAASSSPDASSAGGEGG